MSSIPRTRRRPPRATPPVRAASRSSPGSRPASLGLVTDVTDRRRAEEAPRRSEEQYRQVVENATEGISVIADRRFLFADERMGVITGYDPEELLAMSSAVALVHPDDRPLVGRVHRGQARRDSRESSNEFRLIHKSGRIVWVIDNAAAIDWRGRPATLSFTSDITARKELACTIREAVGLTEHGSEYRGAGGVMSTCGDDF